MVATTAVTENEAPSIATVPRGSPDFGSQYQLGQFVVFRESDPALGCKVPVGQVPSGGIRFTM